MYAMFDKSFLALRRLVRHFLGIDPGLSMNEDLSPSATKRLVGSELLAKIKASKTCSQGEILRRCGYELFVGRKSVCLWEDFNEQLIKASAQEFSEEFIGISIGDCIVNESGELIIPREFVKDSGLQPGDQLEILLGPSFLVLRAY